MLNAQLLDDKIDELGLKHGYIAEKLGISRQAYNNKRKGRSKIRVAEIYVLCDLLGLSEEEKERIFFAKKV